MSMFLLNPQEEIECVVHDRKKHESESAQAEDDRLKKPAGAATLPLKQSKYSARKRGASQGHFDFGSLKEIAKDAGNIAAKAAKRTSATSVAPVPSASADATPKTSFASPLRPQPA